MKAEFTPGPWRCAGHRQIATTRGAGLPICEVWSGGVGIEQADANEALIAAAPELFEALFAYVQYTDAGIETDEADRGEIELAEKARAALEKARGEQQ